MNWKLLENNAHAPYSGLPKACVVESKSGKFYAGVRVENISYPLSIPAVQAACSICLSEGETPAKIYLKNQDFEQLNFWVQEFDLQVNVTEHPPEAKFQQLKHEFNKDEQVLTKLKTLLKQAVTPNSDFPVSAILFVEDGCFAGVNVEVSEWTKGLCAERVAIVKAYAAGYRKFQRIEVHTLKGEISSPCGACRQVILEHLPYHTIKMHHADGTLSEHLTVDLLPFSFKSTALKK
ncbi:MAG: cytidine deaminase [Balneolaceae bacterium]